ncbi:hypothetical protein EVAR_37618_1 [Eumeta japonica]|uniref:CUB domain-containing protein n=1 Tax=Eumeta variegata TaxID=151549 RepID=A0A4C1VPC8_EUMVA|nr:hypothetical protein EVAR_37618_1 [Eumeta japonica]
MHILATSAADKRGRYCECSPPRPTSKSHLICIKEDTRLLSLRIVIKPSPPKILPLHLTSSHVAGGRPTLFIGSGELAVASLEDLPSPAVVSSESDVARPSPLRLTDPLSSLPDERWRCLPWILYSDYLFCSLQYTWGSPIYCEVTRRQTGPGSIFTVGNGEQCLGSDRTTGGVCLSRNQCNTQGGKAIGFCGVFATCCSLNACDVRTNTKVAVFINPPLDKESSGLECSYNVEINNNNVCQMRIDFETFNLAPPTTVEPVENVTQRPGYTCRNDIFQVTNLQANSDFLPPLCGDNNGQHRMISPIDYLKPCHFYHHISSKSIQLTDQELIKTQYLDMYVRVNASTNSRTIRINFKIADRNSQPNLPQATWKIKVTQLECFNTLGKYRDGIFEAITSSLPSSPLVTSADRDEYLIAPPGCLQFYPDRAGSFESFNYNRGAGPYIANLAYATCFKKTPDVCGVKSQNKGRNCKRNGDKSPAQSCEREREQNEIGLGLNRADEKHVEFIIRIEEVAGNS